ncbi:hypothetical protein HDU96_002591, partial [Phlyctochytrium bullatum]
MPIPATVRILAALTGIAFVITLAFTIISQATASLFYVSETLKDSTKTSPAPNWVGPWTLCSSDNCRPLPLPCPGALPDSSNNITPAFFLRQQYNDDERLLCSRFLATRGVFVATGALELLTIIGLLYAISVYSLRFFVCTSVLGGLSFFFNLALAILITTIRGNLDNLRDIAARDPLVSAAPDSGMVTYSFAYGFWLVVLALCVNIIGFVVLVLCAVLVRRKKREAQRPVKEESDVEDYDKDYDGFLSSPYPDNTRPSINVDRDGFYRPENSKLPSARLQAVPPHHQSAVVAPPPSNGPSSYYRVEKPVPNVPASRVNVAVGTPNTAAALASAAAAGVPIADIDNDPPSATASVVGPAEPYANAQYEEEPPMHDALDEFPATNGGVSHSQTISSQGTITRGPEPVQSD